MNSLSNPDMQTLFVPGFPLKIQIIGFGEIGHFVLRSLRAFYGDSGFLLNDESESKQLDELIFLVTGLGSGGKQGVTCSAASLIKKGAGSTLVFTFNGEADEMPGVNCMKMLGRAGVETNDAPSVTADGAGNFETVATTIFDQIRSIASSVATAGSINVGFNDLCRAMGGPSNKARRTIRSSWGEAQRGSRATVATATALSCSIFRHHLIQAAGILVKITANPETLMGRELKEINKQIRSHVSEHCVWVSSICYDVNLPSDVLRLELWTSTPTEIDAAAAPP